MAVRLVLDTREAALAAAVRRLLRDADGVEVAVEPLPVADVSIVPAGADAPRMLLERKALSDLAASIVDGRYREQKARLLEAVGADTRAAGYVIEGGTLGGDPQSCPTAGGVRADALWGAIVNSTCRDGMTVFRTDSVEETALLLVKLARFHATGGPGAAGARGPHRTPMAARAAQPGGVFAGMLAQVPGCSPARAAAVAVRFGTPAALCAALQADRREVERAIAELRPESGENRRLGPALAAAIVAVLLEARAPERRGAKRKQDATD